MLLRIVPLRVPQHVPPGRWKAISRYKTIETGVPLPGRPGVRAKKHILQALGHTALGGLAPAYHAPKHPLTGAPKAL